jgi:hypothetical protein
MKSENTAIKILTMTAIALTLALVFIPKPAAGDGLVWKDQDYMIATFPTQVGGDALYVTDTRNGVMGVFVWDSASRTLEAQALRQLGDAFKTTR